MVLTMTIQLQYIKKVCAMLKNTKAQLMNSMTKSVSTWQLDDINQAKYVIDGGALMHRVKWASKST
jgi:hypothetical protein